ncbi:MAG: M23 family metallopeptidase [Meiothermus sp.]|nr:M23 family metallopeptidase [Meiothermus sp.]
MRRLLLLLVLGTGIAVAQAVHTVKAGENLYRISLRYGTTVEALMRLNGIGDAAQLRVGQVLRVPGPAAGSVVAPRPPSSWPPNPRDPQLNIPPANAPVNRRTENLPIPLLALEWPASVVQGNLALVRLRSPQAIEGQVSFLGKSYAINQNRVLLPVPALQPPGMHPVTFTLSGTLVRLDLRVVAGRFGRFVLQLPPERRALLQPDRLRSERLRVIGVCQPSRPQQWRGNFRRPVESTRVTDPFGTRRSYDLGASYSFHEGIDYGIPVGSAVRAPAPGVVVLAEKLFVRGNGVVVDHGGGVCSGYWHNSSILVKVGQRVETGDLLALSGNTGLSNGPHSHFEIRVAGIPTNPAVWYFSAP